MNVYIEAVGIYLPEKVLDNRALSLAFPEWSVEKIYEKTGINCRHIAASDESCLDMAVSASEELFRKSGGIKEAIDYVLLCTQSPDYFLPTTACLLQSELGLSSSCGALDFNLGCSGYVYGLGLAAALIESGQAENILLVTSELYSRYISNQDKSVRTLFGDAATASLIKASAGTEKKMGPFVYGTDGLGGKHLIVPAGGSRSPITTESQTQEKDASGNIRSPANLFMNGAEVLTFTLKTVPKCVDTLLYRAGLVRDDIDYVVFHQANKFMLEKLRKKCGFTEEQFLCSFEDYGNTVSSTIPLGLEIAMAERKFKSGNKILLLGFGVGYSWAGTIITW